MAQILRPDSIGNLSRTSGTVATLPAGSYVTIGGQQYTNSAALTINTAITGAGGLDTGVIAANTSYYVYGVVSSGALALVASTSSSSPTGFSVSKQIGAFQTDSLAAIDFIFAIALQHGKPLKEITGVETRQKPFIFPSMDARNLVINGNFDFWQRGTTSTVTSPVDQYLADRFRLATWGGGINVVQSRSTDVPTVAESGFASQYSWLLTNNSTSGSSIQLHHIIEGYDYQQIHARSIRAQFWVKSSIAGTYSFGFKGANDTRSYQTTYSINNANTWEKKTFDIMMDTTGSWNFDNGVGVQLCFGISSGTGGAAASTLNQWHNADTRMATGVVAWHQTNGATFRLAQIQILPIEAPPTVDIEFRRAGRTISDELAMCKRYCWAPASNESSGTVVSAAQAIAAGAARAHFLLPVEMRGAPAIDSTFTSSANSFFVTDNDDNGIPQCTSIQFIQSTAKWVCVDFNVSSGLSAGNTAYIKTLTSGKYFVLTAEL